MPYPKILTLTALILLSGCGGDKHSQSAASSTQIAEVAASTDDFAAASSSSDASQPASDLQNVTIASPRAGVPIESNPFTVSGTARTFENHVSLRILDAGGNLIQQTSAIATGEAGNFNPWQKAILLATHPGATVTVEAAEISPKDGSTRSIASRSVPFRVPSRKLTLFFHDGRRAPNDCSAVFPVEREVPATLSIAQLAVQTLIAGPSADEQSRGFSNAFPDGVVLRSVIIRDGVATVDFSEQAGNVGGSCRAQAIRAGTEKTLKALAGIRDVVITAAGNRELALQP